VRGAIAYTLGAAALFASPLARLAAYTVQSDLHSHVVLVPFIVGYLLLRVRQTTPPVYATAPAWAALFGAAGVAALVAAGAGRGMVSENDELALLALAFIGVVLCGGFLFLGSAWMAARAFPLFFLVFMIPMPDAMRAWLENGSLVGSTWVAEQLLELTGTSFLREDDVFWLPGIQLQVARECSGIHSSWVLFIVSTLAANQVLDAGWRRAALVAFVIPLGLVRNGLRIVTIAMLCVHIGPEMVDSPIHHQGGPLFFALSLVPLFLFLHFLRRGENGARTAVSAARSEVHGL
jgi:exosortase C (VPDSG-CTERM-specific)